MVSVIVPVYNAEKHLEECIKSIIDQTYNDLEITIVDDGSTDGTQQVIQSLLQLDNRIKAFSQNNAGVSAARNRGISLSMGEFVCFVDSDDVLDVNCISSLAGQIAGADVVFSGLSLLFDSGKTMQKQSRVEPKLYKSEDFSASLVDDGTLTGILFGSVCGALYRLDIIKENGIRFRENIKINEDGLFNIEYLQKSNNVLVADFSLYFYRQYKKAKKNVIFDSSKLENTNPIITEICNSYPDFSIQMARRKVSIAFWTALQAGNDSNSLARTSHNLKHYFQEKIDPHDFEVVDYKRINRFKRILITLLRKNHFFVFTFLMRYMVPFFVGRVKH